MIGPSAFPPTCSGTSATSTTRRSRLSVTCVTDVLVNKPISTDIWRNTRMETCLVGPRWCCGERMTYVLSRGILSLHAQSSLPFQHSSLTACWKFMPHFPGVLKPHEWGNHWWMGMWASTVIFRFHFHPAGVISTGNLKQRQPWPRCCTDRRQNFLNGKNSLSIYSQSMYSKRDENPCIWS